MFALTSIFVTVDVISRTQTYGVGYESVGGLKALSASQECKHHTTNEYEKELVNHCLRVIAVIVIPKVLTVQLHALARFSSTKSAWQMKEAATSNASTAVHFVYRHPSVPIPRLANLIHQTERASLSILPTHTAGQRLPTPPRP